MNFVRRCENVGWRVEETNAGAKVYSPDGQMTSIHMTYSDVRSFKNLEAQLKRMGLHATEEQMLNAKFNNGLEKTRTSRAAANKKAEELAATARAAASLAKASGPYLTGAEDVGVMWFAEKHPAPWMRWVNITPEIASYLLKNHNTLNRPISDSQVDHYIGIIASGQWHLTHQGIAMDKDAVLQDGQHRLQAIDLMSGQDLTDTPAEKYLIDGVLTVPFAFFVGMPPENFKAIDEGLLRTAAQLFGRDGEANRGTLQTSLRLVIALRENAPRARIRQKYPNAQILDAFNEDPELFRACAANGARDGRKLAAAPGAIAAAHYLLRRANGEDNRYVEAFFEGLATGLKAGTRMVLDDDDPRQVLRTTLETNKLAYAKRESGIRTSRKRLTGLDQLAMIIITWNNLVNSYSPRFLKYTDATEIPRVIICKDTGPTASACPAKLLGEVDGDDE